MFLLGFIAVILIAIPISVYMAGQSQQTVSNASASTTLTFEPISPTVEVGKTLTLNIVLDPGIAEPTTTNQVSFVKLSINYDPTKFTPTNDCLTPNPSLPNTLTSILENSACGNGTASISLSIGADPTNVLKKIATIATLKLKAIAATESNAPSNITFNLSAPNDTQILSIAPGDQTSENVLKNLLSTNVPAKATISNPSGQQSPTSTPAPTSPAVPGSGSASRVTQNASNPFQATDNASLNTEGGTTGITPTVIQEMQITEPPPTTVTLPPTGPGGYIMGLGAIGAIFTIIGAGLLIFL